ncbi:hypothetical protein [Mesorhizobium sp. M7D.F.Ca.US.004.01.2.1]|uniref:hypothetical protein n=1 Tax=Mesorhizobium sp. M7D.F.Ca.US.004.01.2.1 TaxID=2496738 RepID=UPI0019CFC673|nr:hypothetical protein [Mesorhizobium sp. M7D.F.Ca.US.004.01.2.1]
MGARKRQGGPSCGIGQLVHGRKLNLDKLIRLFGEDYVYINDKEISRQTVCTECGHVGAKINVTANTTPTGWSPPFPA